LPRDREYGHCRLLWECDNEAMNDQPTKSTMKAAVCEQYGPPEVVTVRSVPKPVRAADEVLIKVRATTVNSGDARMRGGKFPRGMNLIVRPMIGLKGPRKKVLGFYAAGEVEAVGSSVTRFRLGDRVVGSHGFKFGCHAEYLVVSEAGLIAKIPAKLSFQDAVALCFGGVTALYFFRLGKLARGESILINGASGAVGTISVELAKHLGANVTGVCSSANVELVKRLGAKRVIDYTHTDFTRADERYDLIMDTHGNSPYSKIGRLLKPGGRFLMVVGDLGQMVSGMGRKNVVSGSERDAKLHLGSIEKLLELAAAGSIHPVIGTVLPFEQIAEAYRLVDSGHKVGNVVLLQS
jgi:NADPH:quinone reductase-like Zn-dependent oxidoreductase